MTLITYYMYANLYIILFWVLYKLFLHNEQRYGLNRGLLLLSFPLAMVLPLMQNSLGVYIQNFISIKNSIAGIKLTYVLNEFVASDTSLVSQTSSIHWAELLFLSGGLLTIAFLITGHWRINKLIRASKKMKIKGLQVYISHKPITPFSYNKTVVLPASTPTSERDLVLMHEMLHIRFNHYIDSLLLQLYQVIFWINPLFYLLKRELKEVHEFQVDRRMIDSGVNAIDYKVTLVKFSVDTLKFQLANGLTNCPIKKRLIMMNNLNLKKGTWKYMILFPVLALFFVTLSSSVINEEATLTDNVSVELTQEAGEFTIETMPAFPGGMEALNKYLSEKIVYPDDAKSAGIEGKVYISFIVTTEGVLSDVKVAKKVNPSLDAEALRVVKAMPKWVPGSHEGKPVSVSYVLPIAFKL